MSTRLTSVVMGLTLLLALPSGAFGVDDLAVTQPVAGGHYYVYGRYDVTLKGGSGPLLKGFMFAGEFTLPADPSTVDPGVPTGAGHWAGQIGVFKLHQEECRPMGGYVYPQGVFDIVATVDKGRLSVWIVPHPPASDPLLDIFDTRFSPLEAGGKHLDVPLSGGAMLWGGGVTPMKIECDGIQPGSRGGIGVSKMRDR